MNMAIIPPPADSVDLATTTPRPVLNLTSKLTRIAALAEAEMDQIYAVAEDENLSLDSAVGMAIELGMVLKAEIADLRRLVAMEESARLVGRVRS